MADVIKLDEARRPDISDRQVEFCKELIGIGLTRNTIVGLVIGKDVDKLNHAEINVGYKLINQCREELGYGLMDARRAQSPFTIAAVRAAARNQKVKIRIA